MRLKLLPSRVAMLRLDRDKRLHIIWTDILLPIIQQRRSFVPGAHTPVTRQIFRRLVRGLLQMANMILWNFKIPPVPVRAAEGAGFASRKISENLCGVFNILCYIPALLTNQS